MVNSLIEDNDVEAKKGFQNPFVYKPEVSYYPGSQKVKVDLDKSLVNLFFYCQQ